VKLENIRTVVTFIPHETSHQVQEKLSIFNFTVSRIERVKITTLSQQNYTSPYMRYLCSISQNGKAKKGQFIKSLTQAC
jgi:hypothetical protein